MWHLIPAILCATYVQAHRIRQPLNSPYQGGYINNDRNAASGYYPAQMAMEQPHYAVKQYPEYASAPALMNSYQQYLGQRPTQYNDDPYLIGPYNKAQPAYGYYPAGRANNLRQSRKPIMFGPEIYNFDLEDVSDSESDDSKGSEEQSYFEDLELVENFGNYLKRRTQLDPSSGVINDPAHQYNALLAVIIALAKTVRNSCADFDQIYEQIYDSTVDTYYKYGLANADKIVVMMDDYIRKGYSHMTRLKKLKQELCVKDYFSCSVAVDNKIRNSPLAYVKELETLDALAHLARKYYPYIEEFNQASQKGAVLPYLQNSKERLKEYIMHVVNSVEHLTDKIVKCT